MLALPSRSGEGPRSPRNHRPGLRNCSTRQLPPKSKNCCVNNRRSVNTPQRLTRGTAASQKRPDGRQIRPEAFPPRWFQDQDQAGMRAHCRGFKAGGVGGVGGVIRPAIGRWRPVGAPWRTLNSSKVLPGDQAAAAASLDRGGWRRIWEGGEGGAGLNLPPPHGAAARWGDS